MPRIYVRGPFEVRFACHVDTNGPVPAARPDLGPCHVWIGGKNEYGYGWFNVGDLPDAGCKRQKAHRVAFRIAHRRWPTPEAIHLCDNPSCVKATADAHGPAHVVEGTHADNMRDMAEKGRHFSRTQPSALARGDRHGSRTRPEQVPRGERSGNARLTEKDVRTIRELFAGGATLAALGRRYGVTYQCIDRIVRRINWAHVA